jgi:type I restriction enzyme S subunit
MTGAMRTNGFKQTELGEVLDFFNGKAIKPDGDGDYPAYGSNGPIGHSPGFTHEDGIIIGRVGAYCGSIAYCSGKFWASDNTIVAKPKQATDDIRYFSYLLRDLKLNSYAGGAAQPLVTHTVLKRVPAFVAQWPVQKKISAALCAYDDLIENSTQRIQILERMAQALYREWFVGFRFPGHKKVKLVDSPLGRIPQGWKPGTLGDIAGEVRRGVNPDEVEPDTPYIGLEHMPRKSIALSDWGMAKEVRSAKLAFKKGEILFGKIRPYFHKVGVAAVDGLCSTDAIVIVPKKPEYFALVLACVSSEPFVSHATQTSQGTKMPRANWAVLTKYPLPVPSAPLLSVFSEYVDDAVGLIQNLLFKNRNLRRTRDLLLPKLISGALSVEGMEVVA